MVKHNEGAINAFLYSAKRVYPQFIITENIGKYIVDLIKYFLGDRSSTLDLDRGICLTGSYGVGKSLLMLCLRKFINDYKPFNQNAFRITSIEDILSVHKGGRGLDQFVYNRENGGSPSHLLINEFMKPISEKIYGTEAQVIIDQLIMMRYDLRQSNNKHTHVTTNYIPYSKDKAVNDRYAEMFNIIEITGESFRK